ncbi:MAG TPA: sulfite exporter TauE/SafE family protein [Acetobacteraceae bacterium]|nr:sulfite exporter TauE/SafE family protein [Acetobacteraceae bacterium]
MGRMLLLLLFVAFIAGTQNALAGGGSFITFPALLLTGMDALSANITSTIALFPGQVTTGLAGRRHVAGTPSLSFRALFVISLIGGVLGAALLLATPVSVFERLVPFLVLFATLVFAWGSFLRRPGNGKPRLGGVRAGAMQFLIAVYGGYFGGGIGILMLAALTLAGLPVRAAGATKNVLAGVMNASAVAVFLASPYVHWREAAAVAVGAIAGGQFGAWLLSRVNDRILRIVVTLIGITLTVGLFLRAYG